MNATTTTSTAGEVLPPERSAQGDNAFYLRCEPMGGGQYSYAACIHKIGRIERREASAHPDCKEHHRKGECRAAKLRRVELAEGKAMYYIPREQVKLHSLERMEASAAKMSALIAGGPASRKKPRTHAPEPVAPVESSPAPVDGYAAAISAAVKAHSEGRAVVVKTDDPKEAAAIVEAVTKAATAPAERRSAIVTPARPGESLMEIARRKLAEAAR